MHRIAESDGWITVSSNLLSRRCVYIAIVVIAGCGITAAAGLFILNFYLIERYNPQEGETQPLSGRPIWP